MATTIPGWTTLAEDPAVLIQEYAFGPARANAMAVRLPDGSFMITSPSTQPSDAEVETFNRLGGVSALLENNGVHHLGLGPWRARFPQAVTYAAPRAAARVRKKGKDPGQLDPIGKLRSKLGGKISVIEIAGDKLGDICVGVKTEKGTLFYAGDLFANIDTLPSNPIFKLMFKLTNSGPGLKVFKLFFLFFVADKGVVRDSLISALEADPPDILIPAHGGIVAHPDLRSTLVGMLREAI